MNYDEAQGRAKRDRLKGVEDMEQGLFGLKKAAVEGGIGGGKTAFDQSSTLKRQGMDTGSRIYGTDVESRDKALNREIERLKVVAQNEANKIQREGLDLSRAQTLYSTTMNRMQQLERKLDEDFAGANGMLLMAQQSGKMDSAQKQQLEIAQLELQRQKAALRKEMEPVLAPIRQKLGATSGAGLSKADQSLVDQYLKK
jgi:NADPH-dependent glutamate synthase beta subunit-like oxidoreductase